MPKTELRIELPIDAPERRRLPLLLRRAWYGMNQAFRRRIAHLGVTPDQFTKAAPVLFGLLRMEAAPPVPITLASRRPR